MLGEWHYAYYGSIQENICVLTGAEIRIRIYPFAFIYKLEILSFDIWFTSYYIEEENV